MFELEKRLSEEEEKCSKIAQTLVNIEESLYKINKDLSEHLSDAGKVKK